MPNTLREENSPGLKNEHAPKTLSRLGRPSGERMAVLL